MGRATLWIGPALWLIASGSVYADGEERPAVAKGIEFLKGKASNLQTGEAALAGLALYKSEVPGNDPAFASCVNKVLSRFNGPAYVPERTGGTEIYEAALVVMLLSNLDPVAFKAQIEATAGYLLAKQTAGGGWDYSQRTQGDTSISQYAVLGLWEAENAGVAVPPRTWDRAARWFMSVQAAAGSWNYHRDEAQWQETISMTAAGVGSLLICQRQLLRFRRGTDSINPLLTPILAEGDAANTYKVETTTVGLNNAIGRGITWLARNFTVGTDTIVGQSPYYGMYGIERIGALADRDRLGVNNWFARGMSFIISTQRADGGWNAQHGDVPNTAWSVLFLTKATAKSVRRIEIRRLGAGTLLGGRGLPSDLNSLTIAQGRVVVRPMSGAVEGMLSVLEDPRAQNADSALSGLVSKYQTEGPKLLRPWKDRFRKMIGDRDPGIRRVATWSLGRTGDLDVAPALILMLVDPDENVVVEAATGLQILSRKLEGFGPPRFATADEKKAAQQKWRAWYDAIRPPELDALDEEPKAAPAPAAAPAR